MSRGGHNMGLKYFLNVTSTLLQEGSRHPWIACYRQ
ncbi:hypothetical protein VULLAG_LOCUS5459 [Vulpes lagopus]